MHRQPQIDGTGALFTVQYCRTLHTVLGGAKGTQPGTVSEAKIWIS